MHILAIETSCDETAVAILEGSGDTANPSIKVLGDALYSQVEKHAEYGGVFPALAKREHARNLVPLLVEALTRAKLTPTGSSSDAFTQKAHELQEILVREETLFDAMREYIEKLPKPPVDAIAVTQGPGLEPALWVGLNFAKALSYLWDIPLLPVNHMEGHVVSSLVCDEPLPVVYPALALLVSGGHTELIVVKSPLSYERIGETRDDAVGEAFDKVGRLLGLPYPGGVHVSRIAKKVREAGGHKHPITFPRPMIHTDDFDFSLSGLKTSVLYKTRELGELSDDIKEAICYEFEEAVVDVLVAKTKKALDAYGIQTLITGGGVIANEYLRLRLTALADAQGVSIRVPTRELSTDNAVMIGAAGYLRMLHGETPEVFVPGTILPASGTLRL